MVPHRAGGVASAMRCMRSSKKAAASLSTRCLLASRPSSTATANSSGVACNHVYLRVQ